MYKNINIYIHRIYVYIMYILYYICHILFHLPGSVHWSVLELMDSSGSEHSKSPRDQTVVMQYHFLSK